MSTASTGAPADLNLKVGSRTAGDLSADGGRRTADALWRCVQCGLVYPSPRMPGATVHE